MGNSGARNSFVLVFFFSLMDKNESVEKHKRKKGPLFMLNR